jgi:hypothetical protein
MSDGTELESMAKGGGIVAAAGLALATLWRAFIRKSEKNEDKLDTVLSSKLTHFEKAIESHRNQLEELKRVAVEHETRLRFREGGYGPEPLTNPGMRPTAAIEALRAKNSGGSSE